MGVKKYLEYKRNCPDCGIEIVYKRPNTFYGAVKNNSRCNSCRIKVQYINDPNKNKGNSNGRYGKTLIEVMQNKHGENWEQVHELWRLNVDKRTLVGKDNPAYGKIFKGGRSIKGNYKGTGFRSSLELIFLLIFEFRNGFLPLSGESDNLRAYSELRSGVPDFYCAKCNTVYELKIDYFLTHLDVKAKVEFVKSELEKRGFIYRLYTEKDLEITMSDMTRMKYFILELVALGLVVLEETSVKRLSTIKINNFKKFDSELMNEIKSKILGDKKHDVEARTVIRGYAELLSGRN